METVSIQKILAREFEPILLRRRQTSKTNNRIDEHLWWKGDKLGDVRNIPDTVGLSIAGGGLPAVAFASGAIHALAKGGFLHTVDYISCSEEGTLTAACFVSHLLSASSESSDAKMCVHDSDKTHLQAKTSKFVLAAERALIQLREFSTYGCRCNSSCVVEAILLFLSTVVIPPLLVLSAAFALSSPVESILGESLRQLLTSGLSSFPWYHVGSLVLFAPLICSCACFAYSSILASRGRTLSDLRRSIPWDLSRSQAAAAAAGLGLSAAGLVVIMFVDERLLGGAPLHLHVHPAALLALWPMARLAAYARLMPARVCIPALAPGTVAAGIALCIVWAAARVFSERVMGRNAFGRHAAADAAPLLAFALLVWLQRACYSALARLYRRRLGSALPSSRTFGRSTTSTVSPPSPSAVRLGDVYHGVHRPAPHGLAAFPAAAAAVIDTISMFFCGCNRWRKTTTDFFCSAFSSVDGAGRAHSSDDSDDWALGRLGGGDVPFLLANTAVAGYAPPDLGEAEGASTRAFVVSPVWCGCGATGFFRTPAWMTLSRVVAICCSDGPLAGLGRLGPGLRSGNRLRLPDEEEAQAEW